MHSMCAHVRLVCTSFLYTPTRTNACKDRHWLAREFPEIAQPVSSGDAPDTRPGTDDKGEASEPVEAQGKHTRTFRVYIIPKSYRRPLNSLYGM